MNEKPTIYLVRNFLLLFSGIIIFVANLDSCPSSFAWKTFFRIFPEELGGWCFFLTSNLNSGKKICAQGFRPGVQCVTVDDFDKRLNSSRLWRPLAVTRHRCYQFPLSAMHLEVFFIHSIQQGRGKILNLGGTQLNLIENLNKFWL